MLDQIYKLATPWKKSNRLQMIKNRLLGFATNWIYPIYIKFSKPNKLQSNSTTEVIISLTSFPARIHSAYLCLESLLRQKFDSYRIILWLAKSQFPETKHIPEKILRLKNFGVEIMFCEDIRSYKKIFYTAQKYTDKVIITVDDDTLYPENWLYELYQNYHKYPQNVSCYRAHKVTFDNNRHIKKYKEWIGLSPDEKGPSKYLVPIGVGGVLYPPNYFVGVNFDEKSIMSVCPTVDDLWLKVIGLKQDIQAVKVFENSKEWFTIRKTQKESLRSINVDESNLNDEYLDRLLKFYDVSFD